MLKCLISYQIWGTHGSFVALITKSVGGVMTKKQIEEFIKTAQGTCLSKLEVCAAIGIEEDDIFISDWQIIENKIVLCDVCGWWVEPSEVFEDYGDLVCEECYQYATNMLIKPILSRL